MQWVLLTIHLMIGLAMIGIILLQRSDGDGLSGLGGGSGGGVLSTRGTANLLTRTTAILAALFMVTSLSLTVTAQYTQKSTSILQDMDAPGTPGATPEAAFENIATSESVAPQISPSQANEAQNSADIKKEKDKA